jgi:RNA polymerase sigma factor (sigma-70 family)
MPTSPFMDMVLTAAPRCDEHPLFLPTLKALIPVLSARAARLSSGDYDLAQDLESAAACGVAEAVAKYDPARGLPLPPYAMVYAHRRMADALRRERPINNGDTTRGRATIGARHSRAGATDHPTSRDEQLASVSGGEEAGPDDPISDALETEYQERVASFTGTLPEFQAAVADGLLVRGLTQAELSREQGVSRMAVSKAVRTLRRRVRYSAMLGVYIQAA